MSDRDRIAAIVTAPNLTYRQRVLQLALAAEGMLPYPSCPPTPTSRCGSWGSATRELGPKRGSGPRRQTPR